MNKAQMELTLENLRSCRSNNRLQKRRGRAHQWFERMRQIVDRAPDWPADVVPSDHRMPAKAKDLVNA